MARKKKKGSQDKTLKILVLATAILNLIQAIVNLFNKLLEQGEGGKPPLADIIIRYRAFVNTKIKGGLDNGRNRISRRDDRTQFNNDRTRS